MNMLKPLNSCCVCQKLFALGEIRNQSYNGNLFCIPCYEESKSMGEKLEDAMKSNNINHLEWGKLTSTSEFNEPTHYHQHNIDTIKFLQEGFPPDVFMGFAIGHIIKYAQRSKYKNGREDLVKMLDYSKRALDWYDKTHS